MLDDVVVDTNVFLHSVDTRFPGRVGTMQFLLGLLSGDVHLCIDEGFDLDESRNRSYIGCEYFSQIRFVSLAWQIITTLGKDGRIRKVSRAVDAGSGKTIRRAVADKTDRVFVKVSCNSKSKALVSHDLRHFPDAARRGLRRSLGVNFYMAPDARPLVRPPVRPGRKGGKGSR